MRGAGLAAALAPLLLGAFSAGGARADDLPELSPAQSDYVEHCSGCHGMQGNSAPADIPVLRGRVGYFMCTPAGRDYLIRLPNVAFSAIEDNRELAEMMNFVVFGLGGPSTPRGARPFTATEVARLRKQALTTTSLVAARATIVGDIVRKCGAPLSMKQFYDPSLQTGGN